MDAVIDNHVRTATPVVLEADHLLPAARSGVRAFVLHEPDEQQIAANYAHVSPEKVTRWGVRWSAGCTASSSRRPQPP